MVCCILRNLCVGLMGVKMCRLWFLLVFVNVFRFVFCSILCRVCVVVMVFVKLVLGCGLRLMCSFMGLLEFVVSDVYGWKMIVFICMV